MMPTVSGFSMLSRPAAAKATIRSFTDAKVVNFRKTASYTFDYPYLSDSISYSDLEWICAKICGDDLHLPLVPGINDASECRESFHRKARSIRDHSSVAGWEVQRDTDRNCFNIAFFKR